MVKVKKSVGFRTKKKEEKEEHFEEWRTNICFDSEKKGLIDFLKCVTSVELDLTLEVWKDRTYHLSDMKWPSLKNLKKKATYIVFLHGFMSDLEGKKPKAFLNFAKKNRLGFLALEYSGHGKSSGKFTNGNISKWTKETTLLIKKIVKKNKIILVGSSMGSWIDLN